MASQFIHYEDYAQKAVSYRKTTGFIFGEVSRQAPMSDHIKSPRPPVVVYGASVEEAERLHNAKAIEASIQVKGGRQRKIRADQKTLASIVISHPYLLEDAEQNPKMMAELRSYEQNAINWLKASYGNDLISVIRHDDEPHAHWHALILPLSDPEFKASKLNPGKAAKAKVMQDASLKKLDSKLLNKKGDMAYQAAMRAFQDSFYQKVSKPAGLTRLGPKLRRLTRAEWHLEKTQARALLEVKLEAEAAKEKASIELAEVKAELARLKLQIGPTESKLSIAASAEPAETQDDRVAQTDGMFVVDFFKAISEHQPQVDNSGNADETLAECDIEVAQLQDTHSSKELGTEQIVPTNAAPEVGESTSQVGSEAPATRPVPRIYPRPAFLMTRVEQTPEPTCQQVAEIDTAQSVSGIPEPKPKDLPFGAGNTHVQPVSDNRNHDVKELPSTNEAQGINRRSLAERFRDRLGAQRYKPRLSLDKRSIELSPTRPRVQAHQEPDANSTQQPNVRYAHTYRPDSAKLGLPLGYDPLARFRRKPKPSPDQKPDVTKPDYTSRPHSP